MRNVARAVCGTRPSSSPVAVRLWTPAPRRLLGGTTVRTAVHVAGVMGRLPRLAPSQVNVTAPVMRQPERSSGNAYVNVVDVVAEPWFGLAVSVGSPTAAAGPAGARITAVVSKPVVSKPMYPLRTDRFMACP